MRRIKKLISITILFSCFVAVSQNKETVHLSFDLYKTSCCLKNVKDKNGINHFYINDEHFKTETKDLQGEKINPKIIEKIGVLNISQFLDIANKKRKSLIEKEEKGNKLTIMYNDKVFDKIYLYVRKSPDLIKRYCVEWVEEIKQFIFKDSKNKDVRFTTREKITFAYQLWQWDISFGTGGTLGWQYYHDMAWGGITQYPDPNDDTKLLTYEEFDNYLDEVVEKLNGDENLKDEIKSRILDRIVSFP